MSADVYTVRDDEVVAKTVAAKQHAVEALPQAAPSYGGRAGAAAASRR